MATKQDLATVERVVSLKIEAEVHRLESKIQEAMRHQLWAAVGVMLVTVLASLWLGR